MCRAAVGIMCGFNTTVATVEVLPLHWRHSMKTVETYLCASNGEWSPCLGSQGAVRGPLQRRLADVPQGKSDIKSRHVWACDEWR